MLCHKAYEKANKNLYDACALKSCYLLLFNLSTEVEREFDEVWAALQRANFTVRSSNILDYKLQ